MTLLLALLASLAVGTVQAAPLRVCLEESSPPYSFKFGERAGGFDLALAEAVADRLHRPLEIQWFETEQDEDEILPWQLNALLSDGRCDLLAGFALIASGLGQPNSKHSKLPDFHGITKADRKRRVALHALVATAPYLRTELAIVVPPGGDANIMSLGDLKGRRIGGEVTTLAATLLYAYQRGTLVEDVVTVAPDRDLLRRLAKHEFDAALIELHKAERHNKRFPDAKVSITGYRHAIGFNLGYAALEANGGLVSDVNAALTTLRDDGTLERIAAAQGLTYVAPKPPDILFRLTPQMLIEG
ncbi:MAG: transporter substrate-binding domain-containing protein [Alphaproteobacteria bacterium]